MPTRRTVIEPFAPEGFTRDGKGRVWASTGRDIGDPVWQHADGIIDYLNEKMPGLAEVICERLNGTTD